MSTTAKAVPVVPNFNTGVLQSHTETTSKVTETINVIDYQTSFLWIGCCNNNLGTPNHLTGNFLGNMNYLKISADEKIFLESDFKRVTDYKVYDKSGNGNHLLKKFLNEEGQITIF